MCTKTYSQIQNHLLQLTKLISNTVPITEVAFTSKKTVTQFLKNNTKMKIKFIMKSKIKLKLK